MLFFTEEGLWGWVNSRVTLCWRLFWVFVNASVADVVWGDAQKDVRAVGVDPFAEVGPAEVVSVLYGDAEDAGLEGRFH